MERHLSPLNNCERQPRLDVRDLVIDVKLTDDCTNAVETLQRADPPSRLKCTYHNFGGHDISRCRKFGLLSYGDRRKFVLENHLCFRCLGKHQVKSCTAQPKCSQCSGQHLDIMHRSRNFTKSDSRPIRPLTH